MILSSILFFLAGCINGLMDVLKDRFSASKIKNWNPQFWDASISWKNKYINADPLQGRTYWTIFGLKIQKPVVVTNGWHLFKMLFIYIIILASVVYTPHIFINGFLSTIITILIFWASFGLGFILMYNFILL